MTRTISFFLSIIFAASLAGCIEVATLIRVQRDGSGKVEETVIMSRQLVDQVRSIQEQLPEDPKGKKQKPFSVLDEKQLRRQAEQLGPDVKFVSATRLSRTWGEGYKAVFSFKNINNLKIRQDPNKAPTGMDEDERIANKEDIITFRFAKGTPSNLTIVMPEQEMTKDSTQVETQEADSASEAMMLEMLKGLRFSSVVEVSGTIKETNASYRDGKRITLFDVDFEKLVADKEKFRKVSRIHPNSLEEAKELLKDIPGLKIETNRLVTVKFQ